MSDSWKFPFGAGKKEMKNFKKAYHTVIKEQFPPELTIILGDQKLLFRKRTWKIPDASTGEVIERGLRYGENPGQEAAVYEWVGGNLALGNAHYVQPGQGLIGSITEEDMLQAGKHPGKINLTDVDRALQILRYLTKGPAAVIMKHNNPSGVAYGDTANDAYYRALMADRIAAFGGALVLNRPVDLPTADLISEQYLEVVAGPDYEEGALEILARRKNLRILRLPRMDRLHEYARLRFLEFTSLMDGGLIIQQSANNAILSPADLKPAVASYRGQEIRPRREPTSQEVEDIIFGWAVEQGVTSNSVLYVKNAVTVGIGTGEQDRVGVAEIAVYKAYTKFKDALCFKRHGIPFKTLESDITQGLKDPTPKEEIEGEARWQHGGIKGAVMISDAFFPFRDGVDVGIREGITAIAHPGGSERDFESIQACNEAVPPVAMVFTGQRAFRH
jgi:phosphoribosylaminoimidazolecarboxamide formyltransferase/IMP cyclohydrolase